VRWGSVRHRLLGAGAYCGRARTVCFVLDVGVFISTRFSVTKRNEELHYVDVLTALAALETMYTVVQKKRANFGGL